MKKHPFGHTALVAMGAILTASSAAQAAAAGLPQWNIAEICATDSAGSHCRILESEALNALSGGWATLPEPFRNACLGNLNSPYDKSYRLLSQCLEGQALKGFGKNIDDSARMAGKLAQAATTTTDAPAAAAAATGPAVLPTTSTADLFKMRESWGKGSEAKAVAAPLAAGASSPLPKDEVALPKGFEGQPTVHPLQASPAAQLTLVPQEKIGGALKSLLAEREGWTKGTAVAAAPAPAAPSSVSAPPAATAPAAANSYAVLPTTSTAELIKAREAWGKGGDAKTVDAPLATGAYSPLPKDEVAPPKGFEGQPTVHPLQASPPAQLTPVAPDKIAAALKALFAEREGWLSSPAKPAAAAQPAPASPPPAAAASAPTASAGSGYPILPTTSTAELFKAREAWGQGSAVKSATPKLAAGAKSPLPKNEVAVPKGFSGQPKIHPLVATPAPQPTAVPQDKIADAMKKLLAEREGWGTAPSKAAAKTAAAPAASSKSAEAADCEAKLKAAAAKGVILFKSSSADIDAKSNTTLKALATVAKGCSKGRIRVEGHTDSTGKAEANNVLSQRRAAAVAAYLVKAGVAKDRVEAVGFGADKPVASNDSDEGRAKNRRIEFGVAD